MTVLSIDWDFFFYRDLEAKTMRKVEAADNQGHKREVDLFHFFDWGHNEQYSEVLLNIFWVTRWQIFTSAGLDPLHYTGIRPEWGGTPLHTFLENLRKVFDWSNGILEYADSHMFGYRTLERAKYAGSVGYRPHVVHFDAHHDLGYAQSKPRIDCGNWLTHAIQDGLVQRFSCTDSPSFRAGRKCSLGGRGMHVRLRLCIDVLTLSS